MVRYRWTILGNKPWPWACEMSVQLHPQQVSKLHNFEKESPYVSPAAFEHVILLSQFPE